MTTRESFYAEDLTETANTTTSYVDKVSVTATLENGVDYWVIYSASIANHTNVTGDIKVRLRNDTAGTDLRLINWEVTAVTYEYDPCFGIDKITGTGSAQTLSVGFAAEIAGHSVRCKFGTLLILRADAADQYVEDESSSSSTSTAFVDKTTLNFTPATPGDYLVLSASELFCSFGSPLFAAAQLYDAGSATAYGTAALPSKDVSNWLSWGAVAQLTLAASAQTFSVRFRTANAASTASIRRAAILALRLDVQQNYYYAEDRGSATTNATTTPADRNTLTQTPAAADHLVFWSAVNTKPSGDFGNADMLEGGAIIHTGVISSAAPGSGTANSLVGVRRVSLPASSTTWKFQTYLDSSLAGGATSLSDSCISVIELTDAGGGGPSFLPAWARQRSQILGAR